MGVLSFYLEYIITQFLGLPRGLLPAAYAGNLSRGAGCHHSCLLSAWRNISSILTSLLTSVLLTLASSLNPATISLSPIKLRIGSWVGNTSASHSAVSSPQRSALHTLHQSTHPYLTHYLPIIEDDQDLELLKLLLSRQQLFPNQQGQISHFHQRTVASDSELQALIPVTSYSAEKCSSPS